MALKQRLFLGYAKYVFYASLPVIRLGYGDCRVNFVTFKTIIGYANYVF